MASFPHLNARRHGRPVAATVRRVSPVRLCLLVVEPEPYIGHQTGERLDPLEKQPIAIVGRVLRKASVLERHRVAAREAVERPARGRRNGERRTFLRYAAQFPANPLSTTRRIPTRPAFEAQTPCRLYQSDVLVLVPMLQARDQR